MKILVLADLHLDELTDQDFRQRLGEAICDTGHQAEALIIAGDLTDRASKNWPDAIRWLGTLYPTLKTVIMAGNHDYYGDNIDRAETVLDQICKGAGCAFGQRRSMVLGDTRILMTTLWTDMRLYEAERGEASVQEVMRQARQVMPDYGYGNIVIGAPERELRPKDTIALHEHQKSWLISELAKPWSGKTVVITHHAPSASVAGGMTALSPCFASDLDDLIDRYRPAAWIFGHTHRPAELRMRGGTLLRNVSVGCEYEISAADLTARLRRGLIDLAQV